MTRIRKIMSAVFGIILWSVTALAACVGIMFLIGIKPYVVTTGSMEPAIKTGSVCFINERVHIGDIAAGDVIAFRIGDGVLVTHRVTDIGNDGTNEARTLTTKGDANNIEDGTRVTAETLLGKTVFSVPTVGYLLMWLKGGNRYILVLVLIALMLFLSFLPNKTGAPEENNTDKKTPADSD